MPSSHRAKPFTLLELVIVAVVVVVLAMLWPTCRIDPQRAREAALKANLHTMRQVIASYQQEHGRYPQKLEDLVAAGFLRWIPTDPMTGSAATWRPIVFDPCVEAAMVGVRSGASGSGIDGTLYRRW